MDDYEKKVEELRQLADNLMSVLNPGAPVKTAQNGAAFGNGEAANGTAGRYRTRQNRLSSSRSFWMRGPLRKKNTQQRKNSFWGFKI